jgi:hypothetical protein
MLILICCIVLSQAYMFSWIIPTYQMLDATTVLSMSNASLGFIYLLICAVAIALFSFGVRMVDKRKIDPAKVSGAQTPK